MIIWTYLSSVIGNPISVHDVGFFDTKIMNDNPKKENDNYDRQSWRSNN